MQVRAGDKLPISVFFSMDWEPIVPSDIPTVAIERRDLSTGAWDKPVDGLAATVLASGLCYYDYTTASSGFYEYVVYLTTTDNTVDQQTIVLMPMASGGYADDASTSSTDVKRLLGLVHENVYIDTTSYDSHNNLVSARVRIYSDPASVGTGSNIIGTYTIAANGDGSGKFTYWKMTVV